MNIFDQLTSGLPLAALFAASLGAQPFAPEPPEPPQPPTPPFSMSFHGGSGAQSYLGIGVAEIDSGRAAELKLRDVHGVEVTRVEEGTAADKAGLKVGDVILDFNGQRVEGTEQFMRLVRETPAGREVKIQISRGGAAQSIAVAIGTRKSEVMVSRNGSWFDMPEIVIPDMPKVFTAWSSSMLGIEAEGLTKQLGNFFGVKEGVLVRSVVSASPADKAGVKAGDVLVRIGDTAVTSPGEVTAAVRSARSKKTLPLTIVRDKHESTLTVDMEQGQTDGPQRAQRPPRVIKM